MIDSGLLAPLTQAVGAVHAGAGVHLALRHLNGPQSPALAVLAAVGVFAANRVLARSRSPREVLVRGYVLPVAAPLAVYLCVAGVPSWEAVAASVVAYVGRVAFGTPVWVYLICLAYGLLAPRRPAGGLYR